MNFGLIRRKWNHAKATAKTVGIFLLKCIGGTIATSVLRNTQSAVERQCIFHPKAIRRRGTNTFEDPSLRRSIAV